MLRLRFKISYLAFEAKQTIHQLFLTTILKSYYTLILNGEIPISMVDLYKIQHSRFIKIRDLPQNRGIRILQDVKNDCAEMVGQPLLDIGSNINRQSILHERTDGHCCH